MFRICCLFRDNQFFFNSNLAKPHKILLFGITDHLHRFLTIDNSMMGKFPTCFDLQTENRFKFQIELNVMIVKVISLIYRNLGVFVLAVLCLGFGAPTLSLGATEDDIFRVQR